MEWIHPQEGDPPEEFIQAVGGNQLVSRILYRRGLTSVDKALVYLNPDLFPGTSPYDFPGMMEAVDRLELAIQRGESILVWGDYDVDGQTATALLCLVLQDLGASVQFHVPVRSRESHGISIQVLNELLNQSKTDSPIHVLLTCDTGISANTAIRYANSQSIDVIVTDHHELPMELPSAVALINPKFLPPDHPCSSMPGVGVAYKLAKALRDRFEKWDRGNTYLDLVALGVVADLALMNGETRCLVQRGLVVIRNSPRPGIKALIELAEIVHENINEEHIAYELAPRLNSVGRLGDANLGVDLLITSDMGTARLIANQLEVMNNHRKLQTNQVFQAAIQQIEQDQSIMHEPIIVVSHSSWPAGVIGIVASRLVERFGQPAIVISIPDGELGRGSARSIAGINITSVLQMNADLFVDFGGHPMAAGFSISPDRISELRRRLAQTITMLEPPTPAILFIDAWVQLGDLTLDLAKELERLSPFGVGNPPCVLVADNLRITNFSKVGRNAEHLSINLTDGSGHSSRAIWWQGEENILPQNLFDLAFTIRSSSYRGQPVLQVEWVDFHTTEDQKKSGGPWIGEIVDYRESPYLLAVLEKLVRLDQSIQVWAEGPALARLAKAGIQAGARMDLSAGRPIVVWTAPPSSTVYRSVIARTRPNRLYLLCAKDGVDEPRSFLTQLAGMVKYSLAKDMGSINLEKLAARLGQERTTIETGLGWLEKRGLVTIQSRTELEFFLSAAGTANLAEAERLFLNVQYLLEETKAYRAYFSRVEPDNLMLPEPTGSGSS